MQIRRSAWLITVLSVFSALSMSVWTVAPAAAASPHARASARPAHKAAATCTKRNKATGTITYSDWQFPDTLNIYQTGASVSIETIDSLSEALAGFDQNAKVFPDVLASLPKPTQGGKVWVTSVKKGIHWSDGREITAADVKFGWQIEMHPDSGPYCLGTCDAIARIDTSGKYGLRFVLKRVYAPFVTNALTVIYPWPTSWPNAWPKGDVKAATDKLFQDTGFNFENTSYPTNGAYQTQQFVANERIVLTPMKYYTTMSCGAKVAQLLFAYYSSKPGLIAAAAGRQTDTTTNYTLADMPNLLQHKSVFTTHQVPGFDFEHLILNHDATYRGAPNPLHDTRVRVALALALDKLGLIRSALGVSAAAARSVEGWSPLIDQATFKQPFADPTLKGQWDPLANGGKGAYLVNTGSGQALADAKKLLAQAGHPGGGFSVEGVTTTGNAVRQAEFAIIQASWAKVGVTFKPDYIPASKLFSDYAHGAPGHTGDFQVEMYTSTGSPDPDTLKTTVASQFIDRLKATHSAVNANDAGINDKIVDTDMAKGAGTLNKALRAKYYKQFQAEMVKKAHWIVLYYRPTIATENGRIGNFLTNPTGAGEQWNTFAWVRK